jgi:hypothetical protein
MNKTVKEKEAVLNVFAALIRPLMRVAFEYGISASEISGVVRRCFIQALESRLHEQNRTTTDARIAIVAGLPKSDVRALRDALRAGAPHSMRATVSLDQITSLLTAWHNDSSFSGAYGMPLDLDLSPTPGSPRRSFKELVALACPSADEEALLDELVAARSVEVLDSNTARCLSRAYVPPDGDVMRIERTGRFLGVVAANFVHNLLRADDEPAYFERTVVSDELLSESGRDKLLSTTRDKGQELIADLDVFLTGLGASDSRPNGKRYGVGIYFFEEFPGERTVSDRYADVDKREIRKPVPPPVEEIDVLAPVYRKK